MTPNKRVFYVDGDGAIVAVDEFCDPELAWVFEPGVVLVVVDGRVTRRPTLPDWRLRQRYGGEPLDSWLVANPRPNRRPG